MLTFLLSSQQQFCKELYKRFPKILYEIKGYAFNMLPMCFELESSRIYIYLQVTSGSILFHGQIAWKFPRVNIGDSCNERAGEEARASVTFILHQGSLFCIASRFAFVSQVFHTTLQPLKSPARAKAHSSVGEFGIVEAGASRNKEITRVPDNRSRRRHVP